MKKWLTAYLQFEILKDTNNYRRNITANLILSFAFLMLCFYTYIYFYNGNAPLFYTDGVLLTIFPLVVLLFKRKKNGLSHITLLIMGICLLYIIHINKGQHYLPIWSFIYIYVSMILYGHQKGLLLAIIYYFITLSMLHSWIGNSISFVGYIRFTSVAVISVVISYLSEYLISQTFNKLTATQKELEISNKTDSLTSLYNRRHFDNIFYKKIKKAKHERTLLAFAMVDIDYFKLYNDTYGHQAGDQALVTVSDLLKKNLRRSNDAVFRLGGEEFALLFKVKNATEAYMMVEGIRRGIEELKIQHSKSTVSRYLTVSCGLEVITSEHEISEQKAYKICDDFLYQAKHAGRNQTFHLFNLKPQVASKLQVVK